MKRADFEALKKGSRRFSDSLFSVVGVRSLKPMLAVTIASKQIKLSSARNKLKRRVRETSRDLLLSLAQPIMVVVFPSKGAEKAPIGEVKSSLKALFSRFS